VCVGRRGRRQHARGAAGGAKPTVREGGGKQLATAGRTHAGAGREKGRRRDERVGTRREMRKEASDLSDILLLALPILLRHRTNPD